MLAVVVISAESGTVGAFGGWGLSVFVGAWAWSLAFVSELRSSVSSLTALLVRALGVGRFHRPLVRGLWASIPFARFRSFGHRRGPLVLHQWAVL